MNRNAEEPAPGGGAGRAMLELMRQLYPFCRSITGGGVRATLDVLKRHIPLETYEVATGTRVFDWTVPREWNIRDASIRNSSGERVVDFVRSNLHVVGYSVPVRRRIPLDELRTHLHTIPERPDWVPYRTSYYKEDWGFCLSRRQYDRLTEPEYDVEIDSSLTEGHLSYGEYFLPGTSEQDVLVSAHVCHPSLANDNLSGIALSVFLARHLQKLPHRYSYRFLFIPGTIGSITWLSQNQSKVGRIRHGVVLSCVGDPGKSTYKKSRRGDAPIDRAFQHVLKHAGTEYAITEFVPYGYDERQFCSPGFDLPVGCYMRTPHGQYPQYHTSADDLEFVAAAALEDSFYKCCAVIETLEGDATYINRNPMCEPQLGKRGLYRSIGGQPDPKAAEMAMLWVLNLSDGAHSLLDIAERSGIPMATIRKAADALAAADLLEPKPGP